MVRNEVNVEFGKCSFEVDELPIAEKNDEPDSLSETEGIRSGSLYFNEHRTNSKHFPFILAHYSADMDKLIAKLLDDWKLPLPRIILFTIADTEDSPSREYTTISRKLVKGLVQALNTTDMWLCSNGLNEGLSRDIGKTFESARTVKTAQEIGMQYSDFPKAALIGICEKDRLTCKNKFEECEAKEQDAENEDVTKKYVKKDINPSHEYFIVVKDNTKGKTGMSKFILNFARCMSNKCQDKSKSIDSRYSKLSQSREIPVMALLLHGQITQIDLLLGFLKLRLPLVIFEGSGGLADLLAYAYRQATYCPEGRNLAEYIESVLKPQVSNRMRELCPNFSDHKISYFTEKVFSCVRYSELYDDQNFITVLNLNNIIEYKSSDLTYYLLRALFKSTSYKEKGLYEMKEDLFLAMDWNCAEIAMEVFFAKDGSSKFKIDNETFFRALTKPQREDFVRLFINEGFVIHTFLDSANLLNLFLNSMSTEFFRSIVWEIALGFGPNVKISRHFLDSKLIILLEELTGIPSLIHSYELDWNCLSIYDDRSPAEAERKAVAALALWAILSYRVQLVKTLWRHSEQPIHIALACSVILKKLEAFVTDLNLKNEMMKESEELSKMAVGIMTLCYEKSPCRALDLLNEKNRVWSRRALMEIAAFAGNKMFLAHPSCQKYLDDIFMGRTKIKDLPYGDMKLPLWLKVVLSAFLIFPIYLWVKFEISEEIQISDTSAVSKENSRVSKSMNSELPLNTEKEKSEDPGFFLKIYYVWSAPITKFWVYHVFYVLFLFCFSVAVIWPACGNEFLDMFTCIWIATIILDSIYNAYILHRKYANVPLTYRFFEISIMIIFLFCYAMGRLILKQAFMTPYAAKVLICFGLLYFYYRVIFTSLPISSNLGPMLYRVKKNITGDFLSYFRIVIVIIIGNTIAFHAAVFPDYPLSLELMRRLFFDGVTSFFLVPADDYAKVGSNCILLQRNVDKISFVGDRSHECKVGRYYKFDCPNPGVWPYLLALQYLLILRLIFESLLIAFISNTTFILEEEGENIWKYQRYQLIANFSNRLTLPPPLSVITFIYMVGIFMWKQTTRYVKYLLRYKAKPFRRVSESDALTNLSEIDFLYWKDMAKVYYEQTEQETSKVMTAKKRMERLEAITDALNDQRVSLRNFVDHINELQAEVSNAFKFLEVSGIHVSARERLHVKNVPHIFSRVSPYPNTMIPRFPVIDNNVPWENSWNLYDPITFSMPTEDFPVALRPFVDVDIQRKKETEGEEFWMPSFNWNKITVSPGGISVNRKSWITDISNRAVEYGLDSEDLPKNPVGRTGLKGRGCLPKWGPNHYMYVVITRWHEEMLFGKYLDVLLMNSNGFLCLPGGYVHSENRYEVIWSLFQCEEMWEDSQAMIAFFESLKGISSPKRPSVRKSSPKENAREAAEEFLSKRVKLGYMDEETNTDQAWCEAEVWHFHYNTETTITDKVKADIQWYRFSEERILTVPIGQGAIIHSIGKEMKAVMGVV